MLTLEEPAVPCTQIGVVPKVERMSASSAFWR